MLATALPDYVDYMQRVRPRIVPERDLYALVTPRR